MATVRLHEAVAWAGVAGATGATVRIYEAVSRAGLSGVAGGATVRFHEARGTGPKGHPYQWFVPIGGEWVELIDGYLPVAGAWISLADY